MTQRELFREIGWIDEEFIEEAMDWSVVRQGGAQAGKYRLSSRSHRRGLLTAAACLIIFLTAVAWSGGFTAMASKISNYLSGIIRTPNDVMDLGSAESLNIGRVEGLNESLCKYYTSFEDMEADLGLDLLEYSDPYELSIGGNSRPILLQYFDFNESGSISVPVTITESDGERFTFSYEMDFLTGNDGRLGALGFVGEDRGFEMEEYLHPDLEIPVVLVTMPGGRYCACFIYENVRYSILLIPDKEMLKELVEKLR